MDRRKFESERDPLSLIKVRGNHEELGGLIGNLSSKLSNLYNYNEKEFLSAYRVHTLEIQTELKELQDRVKKAEDSLNDDSSVAKLEHEVSWFSDEMTRLRSQALSMKNDYEHMVKRMEALKEQRQFLSEQLKGILKRNRVYEAEIEYATKSANNTSTSQTRSGSNQHSLTHSSHQYESQYKIRPGKSNNNTVTNTSSSSFPLPSPPGSPGSPMRSRPQSPQDNLTFKQPEFDVHNSMTPHDARIAIQKLKEQRSNLEEDLEESIAACFAEEVLTRKVTTQLRTASRTMERTSASILENTGGLSGMGVEYFSETDRLSAMVRFLNKPQVFEQVVKVMKYEHERRMKQAD